MRFECVKTIRRAWVAPFLITIVIAAPKGPAVASDFCREQTPGGAVSDFNGDGFCDLAIGVPNEGVGSIQGAGAVNVLYGSAGGLSGTGSQFLHQNFLNIEEDAEQGDQFGFSVATGDFDGDGFGDLAVG